MRQSDNKVGQMPVRKVWRLSELVWKGAKYAMFPKYKTLLINLKQVVSGYNTVKR